MAALVPLLTHLPAPRGFAGLRLDRFSPNFTHAREMGFDAVQPLPAYRHIYGFPDEVLSNLAYAFTYRHADGRNVASYVRPLLRELRRWQRAGSAIDLFSFPVDGRLLICDFRPGAREPLTTLTGLDRMLYEACDEIADMRRLAAVASPSEVADRLGPLVERGLILKDGGRHLALAMKTGEYVPSAAALDRLDKAARGLEGGLRARVRQHCAASHLT
jgi:magnesium-protoporphyrin IX monomethyl ester (oxidative) cyclase